MANVEMTYEGKEPYIFISYAHKDVAVVMPIIEELQSRGFRVWYDKGIAIGMDWSDYIAEHIQHCECFIPFISRHALESPNCKREIGFANDENKPFVTIHLEVCELSAGFRFQLNATQAMFFYKYSETPRFLEDLCSVPNVLLCRSTDDMDRKENEYDEEERYYRENWSQMQTAAERGDADACFDLGHCYDVGIVVEQDDAQAFYWYRRSAELGDMVGQYNTGLYYLNGYGTTENAQKAVEWFRKSAYQGYVNAQFMLGECYDCGWGVPQNYAYAVIWYQEAAKSEHLEAQYQLGLHYEKGRGVALYTAAAIQYYLKVANEQTNVEKFVVDAQFRLGEIYNNKNGAQYNVPLAVHWYRRAAGNGHSGAQKALEGL